MLDAICIGSSSFDVLYQTNKAFVIDNVKKEYPKRLLAVEFGAKLYSQDVFFTGGGGGSNTAIALSKLGLKTGIISRVGDDEQGKTIIQTLRKQKVQTSYVQKDSHNQTAFSFIVSQKEFVRDRTIFVHRGANDYVRVESTMLKKAKPTWIVVSSLGMHWEENMNTILSFGAKVAWNPSPNLIELKKRSLIKYIAQLDILSVNKEEAYQLAQADPTFNQLSEKKKQDPNVLLVTLQSWGPRIVVITDGEKGAYGCNGEYCVSLPIRRSGTLIDKTGAGDAFFSGFVAGYHYYQHLEKAMKMGMANSHHVVQKIGAQNGLLSLAQIKKEMKYY